MRTWRPGSSRAVCAFLGAFLFLSTGIAGAEEVATEDDGASSLRRWQGSSISYTNQFSALSLDKAAELDYNPYYAMSWSFSPRFWAHEKLWFASSVSLTRELTHSNMTTYAGETLLSDVQVRMGSPFYTLPVLEIAMGAEISGSVPTSKVSQARTLITSLGGAFSLSRRFPVLSGLNLSYSLRGGRNLHRFTTGEFESPRIGACDLASGQCDSLLNTGLRNVRWRMSNTGTVGMEFVEWLGLSVTAGITHAWLYPSGVDDERISDGVEDPRELRYGMVYVVDLHSRPMPSLGVSLGMSTISAHRGPDQEFRSPFYNRDTTFYLSLALDIDGLVTQLTPEREEAVQ